MRCGTDSKWTVGACIKWIRGVAVGVAVCAALAVVWRDPGG